MADRRGLLVPLLIITFIFLSPGPAGGPATTPIQYRRTLEDAVAQEQRSLSLLQNSSYIPGRFSQVSGYGLNLTGFEEDRGYAWDGLPKVQKRAVEHLQYALGEQSSIALGLQVPEEDTVPLYGNVTGFVLGNWVRSQLETDLTSPRVNLSDYAPVGPFGPLLAQPFGRNITGSHGEIRINFHERDPERLHLKDDLGQMVTDMDLELSISDADSLEEHDLRLHGFYFQTAGHAVLSTTSDKFAGVFALPHFTLSEPMFQTSRKLLNTSITRAINRQLNGEISAMNPWTSTGGGGGPSESPYALPECEVIVYLQQLPPSGLPFQSPSTVLHFLEQELRFPTGAFLPQAPEMHFSLLAFSPDCGWTIESEGPPNYSITASSNHLRGPKIEQIWTSGRHHLLLFTGSIFLQLLLLMRQMREASTPSTRSKISFYTIAMLALGDGFTTMSFLLTSIFVHGLWVNLIGTAFVAFISVSFFGMRLLMDIWAVQAPERIRREREEMEARRERVQEALQRVRALRSQANELRAQAAAGGRGAGGGGGGGTAVPNPAANPSAPPTAVANPAANPSGPPTAPSNAPQTTSAPIEGQPNNETTPTNGQQTDETSATPPAPNSINSNATPPLAATQNTTSSNSAPATTTPQRPTDTGASPIFMPSDQDDLAAFEESLNNSLDPASNVPSFGALYTRFYLLLLATLFISLNAASWPYPFRRVFFTLVSLAYLSFWLPQINRNVQRNCRRALNWEFVLGQSLLRLVPFAYFYGYARNILFAERDLLGLAVLAGWVWCQVVLLVSQEIVGPRWFVRKGWAPPAYDYHPVLREDEEGDSMPIGFSQAAGNVGGVGGSPAAERRGSLATKEASSNNKERPPPPGKRVFDCAICMQDLEVPVVEAGGADAGLGAGLLARRTYMVTPCRHIFHSACLEGWMKFRLQCPICRETLPPL